MKLNDGVMWVLGADADDEVAVAVAVAVVVTVGTEMETAFVAESTCFSLLVIDLLRTALRAAE